MSIDPTRPSGPDAADPVATSAVPPSGRVAADQRGSVLIFVIGVLLLLAIVATAFLGSSRSDRTSTQQNSFNTQVDLLLQGVLNVMKGAVLQDGRFNTSADQTDSPNTDKFIASRVPVPADPTQVTATTASPPMWPFVTAPQLDSVFSYPMLPADISSPPVTYTGRSNLIPTSITYKGQVLPGFLLNMTDEAGTYPANQYLASGVAVPAIDADGDGIADSGMVKLPIGPIAGVTYYYGARIVDLSSAVNVNTAYGWNETATAGTTPGNFSPANVDLYDMLTGVVADRNAQMNNPASNANPGLNSIRFGQTNPTTDTTAAASNVSMTPYDDNKTARADYVFTNPLELLWSQLGRRLDNPGYGYETSTNTAVKMQKVDINSSVALARNFVLKDPTAVSKIESCLNLSLLGNNATVMVNDHPFKASDTLNWFNESFAFPASSPTAQTMPLRSVLTGSSPVGRDTPTSLTNTAAGNGATANYHFGDVLTVNGRQFFCFDELNSPYVANRQTAALSAPDSYAPSEAHGLGYWALLTGIASTQKIDVNTADFGEIYWGFRRLLSTDASTSAFAAKSPFPITSGSTPLAAADRNKWRMYRSTIRDPRSLDPAVTTATNSYAALTAAGGRFMTPSEMVQLRSALAAVNTLDMRDGDDDITARHIRTSEYNSSAGATPVPLHDVVVFGTERQPYITEVYVDNDSSAAYQGGALDRGANPKGYVAVELYNPYNQPLNLNGWQLGIINRNMQTAPAGTAPVNNAATYPLHIDPVQPGLTPPATPGFDNTYIIPANGYLVLENFDATGVVANVSVNDAKHRPSQVGAALSSGTTLFKYVPNLHQVLYDSTTNAPAGIPNGGELVILRPRKDNLTTGTPTFSSQPTDPVDPCDEGTAAVPNLYDLVPVDSFDFSTMYTAPAAGPFLIWHYARENGTTPAAAWKWTQGRLYNVTTGTSSGTNQQSTTPRQGSASAPFNPGDADPTVAGAAVAIGNADALGTPSDPHLGVQINAQDWPGPKPVTGTTNTFPAGAFARPTDLFKIPYIGAYKILTLAPTVGASITTADGLVVNIPAQADGANALGAAAFTEMNALPMDESFADDDDGPFPMPNAGPDDGFEQVGRPCPLSTLDPVTYKNYPYVQTPLSNSAPFQAAGVSPRDWYDPNFNFQVDSPVTTGARSLFDIFTVDNKNNALPNVGADEYVSTYMGASVPPTPAAFPQYMPAASSPTDPAKAPGLTYAVAGAGSSNSQLTGQANMIYSKAGYYNGCVVQVLSGAARGEMAVVQSSTAANPPVLTFATNLGNALAAGDIVRILGTTDSTAPDHGLININTAPWYVLDRLPLAVTSTGAIDRAANSVLAKQIVLYRDGNPAATGNSAPAVFDRTPHGPFKSLTDLNRVLDNAGATPLFQTAGNTSNPTGSSTNAAQGDITPLAGPTSVAGDFENRYLTLSRVANMITTKSDGYVIYVNLQGWRGAGTSNAQLVVQRRAALIVDRSGATQTNQNLNVTAVPSN